MEEKYLAAIEICSSKIIGAVGRATPQGMLDVIAVEQEPVVECVRHGIIHNVEETATRIARILASLERRPGIAPRAIRSLYVGLSGRSLRNVPKTVTRTFAEETEITRDMLAAIRDDARRSQIDSSLEVIEAIPACYHVNKMETASPVGNMGSSLQGSFQLIAARPMLRRHLERVIKDKVGLAIARTVVTPLAVADLILTEDERRLGCVLVDMGAETTTVSIYKDGALRYLSVLPMGSRNITRDITTLNIMEKDAEEIKLSSAMAIAPDSPSNLNINGVRLSDVYAVVVARAEEIVANIIEQVVYSGIPADQLPGGYVVVGGGFSLKRMAELLARQSAKNVRRGALPSFVTVEDAKCDTYETIAVASIMNVGRLAGEPECLEMPQTQEMPVSDFERRQEEEEPEHRKKKKKKEGPSRSERLWSRLSNIFTAADDDDDPDIE